MTKKDVASTAAKGRGGRPSNYSLELVNKICDEVADGKSLRAICKAPKMPSANTVRRWLIDNEEFRLQYARAREEQADHFADEIIDIADSVMEDAACVAKAKLQIDARKWKAAKQAPKKYGDKIEHTGGIVVETKPIGDIFE